MYLRRLVQMGTYPSYIPCTPPHRGVQGLMIEILEGLMMRDRILSGKGSIFHPYLVYQDTYKQTRKEREEQD